MRLVVIAVVAIVSGFLLGVSFQVAVPSSLLRSAIPKFNKLKKIWEPTNPRGAERLPPGIIESESDLYFRRLFGKPSEDLPIKPKYLVTFTVDYAQKMNVDAAAKKFSENFTILLFHYDGRASEWDEFEWSQRAIHVSAQKQTKWWYAKRFLHPDIVAPYDYIFMWDEDLGVEHFNADEYVKLARKNGLEISQPGLEPTKGSTWQMTERETKDKPDCCTDPNLPTCATFVEIMATVFSRDAWRCVWHMIQNDLAHGWALHFALKKCANPAQEKIEAVDAQWIAHQSVRSLGDQEKERCRKDWTTFQDRMATAERAYFETSFSNPSNTTAWTTFEDRMATAEKGYFETSISSPSNTTVWNTTARNTTAWTTFQNRMAKAERTYFEMSVSNASNTTAH